MKIWYTFKLFLALNIGYLVGVPIDLCNKSVPEKSHIQLSVVINCITYRLSLSIMKR